MNFRRSRTKRFQSWSPDRSTLVKRNLLDKPCIVYNVSVSNTVLPLAMELGHVYSSLYIQTCNRVMHFNGIWVICVVWCLELNTLHYPIWNMNNILRKLCHISENPNFQKFCSNVYILNWPGLKVSTGVCLREIAFEEPQRPRRLGIDSNL